MTLRQIDDMARARQAAQWERTASIICTVHNANCTKRSDQRMPWDFMPPPLRGPRPMRTMSTRDLRAQAPPAAEQKTRKATP